MKPLTTDLSQRQSHGQISIMVGVMMTTFLLFFAFVINTGMLVNAKINLQNAADLAAYAGASVQARQLTQISYLNYEMRRQWKKFLFRIYVLGNMSQDAFMDSLGQTGRMNYYPNRSQPDRDYVVPSTCVIYNESDNFCHLSNLPKISIPPESFMDSISETLRSQLQSIENIRQLNCKGIGLTNLLVNLYWLYNTDPDLQNMSGLLGNLTQEQINTLNLVQGLTTGLGIVPRELILKYRIQTLENYVNAQVKKNITFDDLQRFRSAPDPSYYERTLQAFLSAYYTLGNHTFAGNDILMDELIPGTSDRAQVLKLRPILQSFDIFSINPIIDTLADDGSGNCLSMINPLSINQGLPVGFAKDPTLLTYYAVRLKAKARLLFSPFGLMELKAYAAAQPFGSRIGPDLEDNSFGYSGGPIQLNSTSDSSYNMRLASFIPSLPVQASDSLQPTSLTGWNTKEVMSAMYTALRNFSGGSSIIGSSAIERAYHFAMAPNPWEATRYNIINDQGQDSFVRNFGSDQVAAFWAPIFAPGQSVQTSQDQLRSDLQALFGVSSSSAVGSTGNSSQDITNQVAQTLLNGLSIYLEKLRSGNGISSLNVPEGMNIVHITNPFLYPDGTPITGDPKIILTDSSLFKSSWNSVNDQTIRNQGRVGYSVKLVSFDSLTNNKLTTDGNTRWNNSLSSDPETQSDIPFIKH